MGRPLAQVRLRVDVNHGGQQEREGLAAAVSAMDMTSRPDSAAGHVWDCTGVGEGNPHFASSSTQYAGRDDSSKVLAGFGGSRPVTRMPRAARKASTSFSERDATAGCSR